MKEPEGMKNTNETRPSKQNKINTFKNYLLGMHMA